MARPGDEQAVAAEGRGHLRASREDREQMIDVLKAAFVQGRLTKDEFDARIDQTLASRTYAELAVVTAGLPARPARARSAPGPPRRRASNAVRWGASGFITPAILAAAFAFGSLPGGGGIAAAAFVIAFVYFVFWLSAGADMLWQWCSMALPGARMCVRCAHSVTSHHAPTSCTVRQGSPRLWKRCRCAGYVPPGLAPEAVDRRLVSGRSV
jgi:Domain of unknown function (DUF1707)